MKKQRNLKYEIKSEINIVPFLDILLVLLTIFMMIPSKLLIEQTGFEVNFPNNNIKTNTIKNSKCLITIEILGMGVYNLIINDKKILRLSLSMLISEINFIQSTNSKLMCLIAASKEEKYNEIIQILNVLNNIGINSIGMIIRPTQKQQ